MNLRRLLLAAGLGLALAPGSGGCVLVDTGELRVLPEGPLEADTTLSIRIACPCTRVSLEMDGHPLVGDFPVGQELSVAVGGDLSVGEHELLARALDGQPRTTTRRFTVVRSVAFLSMVSPSPGELARLDPATSGPFKARLSFSRPLAVSRVGPATVQTGGEAATAAVLADGTTLEVTFARSLHEIGAGGKAAQLAVSGEVLEQPFAERHFAAAWTLGPQLQTHVQIAALFATRGPVDVTFQVTGARPPWIDVILGGAATLRALPPASGDTWRVSGDVTAAPEGIYPIGYAVDVDHHVTSSYAALRVDRTPPSVTGDCRRLESGLPSRNECIYVPIDDPTSLLDQGVLRSGTGQRGFIGVTPYGNGLSLCPEPAPLEDQARSETLELSLSDLAGNVAAPVTCTASTPSWDPYLWYTLPPTVSPASSVWTSLGRSIPSTRAGNWSPLEFTVGAPGSPEEGRQYYGSGGHVLTTLNQTAGRVDRAGPAWVERAPGGSGAVYAFLYGAQWISGPLNLDAGRDARDASWSLEDGLPAAAWSEGSGAGRVLVVRNRDGFLGSPARLSSDAVAEEPSFNGSSIAWVEATPGGPRTLRVAELGLRNGSSSRWDVLLDDGNLDPAADAAEPALFRTRFGEATLAWREGGRVLARFAPASAYPTVFGPPVVLNADPARAARSPRVVDRVVYWIEDSPDGDQIRAAAWNGTAWVLAPVPVNDGVPGPVRAMDADADTVVWLRDDGHLEGRFASCLY